MSSGTPTPNLGLPQLDTLDDIVYSELNSAWSKIDTAVGVTVCTSASDRPTTMLYEGRRIRETDTGRYYRYQTSDNSWQLITSNNVDTTTITTFGTNYLAANGDADNPVLTKRNGLVMLRARVKMSAGFTGGVAFTIPAGYRPLVKVDSVRAYAGNAGNAAGPELIYSILTNGDVSIARKDTATTPAWDADTWITVAPQAYLADSI